MQYQTGMFAASASIRGRAGIRALPGANIRGQCLNLTRLLNTSKSEMPVLKSFRLPKLSFILIIFQISNGDRFQDAN